MLTTNADQIVFYKIDGAGSIDEKLVNYHTPLETYVSHYFNDKENLRKMSNVRNTDDQMSLTPTLSEFPWIRMKCFSEDYIFKVGWFRQRWKDYTFPNSVCIFHGDRLKEHLRRQKI